MFHKFSGKNIANLPKISLNNLFKLTHFSKLKMSEKNIKNFEEPKKIADTLSHHK